MKEEKGKKFAEFWCFLFLSLFAALSMYHFEFIGLTIWMGTMLIYCFK